MESYTQTEVKPDSSLKLEHENQVVPSRRQPEATGMEKLTSRLALLVLALFFVALLLEGMLRVSFYHSKDFSMEMWKYAVQLKRPVPNPKLSFAHQPNGHAFLMGVDVRINSQGLRDYEYSLTKPAGVYRIMLLGDSTTFGWGVPLNETTAKILERNLNAKHIPGYDHVEVLNAGVGNYDTVQEVTYFKTRGRAFRPDLVVLVYFINDPEPVPVEHKGFLVDSSYLIAFSVNRFDGVLRRIGTRPDWNKYYSSLYDDNRPGFQACKAALIDLASTTKRENTKLLVAILPELHQINDNYPFTAAHQKIKDVLAAEHAPVLDLIDGLRNHGPESTLWVTPLDDHPNGKANTLVAAQIQDWILSDSDRTESQEQQEPLSGAKN
ncbi:MAG TPA: SGNH/GDSL hydrolase family protein [Terriglobales bacterium]|nr:SGNH/GDSL hydrolase family protein [Terriglobales bacterium]